MYDRYYSTTLPDGRTVCISMLADAMVLSSEAMGLGDALGYFIYEYDSKNPAAGIEVLAKAASFEAATRLADIYLYALQNRPERALTSATRSW